VALFHVGELADQVVYSRRPVRGHEGALLEDNIRTVTRIAAQQRAVPVLSDAPRT
jgi:hypothetical protein